MPLRDARRVPALMKIGPARQYPTVIDLMKTRDGTDKDGCTTEVLRATIGAACCPAAYRSVSAAQCHRCIRPRRACVTTESRHHPRRFANRPTFDRSTLLQSRNPSLKVGHLIVEVAGVLTHPHHRFILRAIRIGPVS